MAERVAVIVVNWNGRDYLQRCLEALDRQTLRDFAVIVVDNGSTDGSVPWLQAAYPHATLLANARNVGFAEANNQGIRATASEYVVLLNNDAWPDPGWLAALVAAADRDPAIGMVACQVCFADRPDRLDSAGIEIDRLGMAWNRHHGQPAADEPQDGAPIEVFGPAGAAALYRRQMLDGVGAFDGRYFAYYEDVELAWRARRAGWRCVYAPDARVAHVHSATAGKIRGFKAYYLGLNKWRTLFKHYPFGRLAGWLPLLFAVDTLAWLRHLVAARDLAALKGRVQGWRERRDYWRTRTDLGDPAALAPWLVRPSLRRLLRR